jgi:Rps23 Pro-64 3,4-dihydroxylase Tpa1-like proline 4-hydroxylase
MNLITTELDLARLGAPATKLHDLYVKGDPFPYIVIDNFLPEADANKLLQEHIAQGDTKNWGAYVHYNERKRGITEIERMGPNTQSVIKALCSDDFITWLHELTGIENLRPDPDLDGGGLHMIEKGGFLNVHVDFLSHTNNVNWSRQLNLLLYLNKEWDSSWNGSLELWNKDMTNAVQKIEPIFNRCVIFHTCPGSYHGHPIPLDCPDDVKRRSLALYYFRDEGALQTLTPTNYSPLPGDSLMKRALIIADKKALWWFAFAKRYLRLKNGFIQRIMKKF